jgi:tRNA pseudouridine38-40 synthase
MRNIKLTIEYDGTFYHGWQSQTNACAVQDVVSEAVSRLTGEECKLTGSSRTDTGVHALGQTANFYTSSKIPADKFSYAINSFLPEDIVIKKSEEVSLDFHSRFSAQGKRYKYLIYNSTFPSALLRHRAWHVGPVLDAEAMNRASKAFLGEHDFAAFSAAGSSVKSTVRTILDVSVAREADMIELQIAGNGFLYNMVRIIAGTLAEVGKGKILPEDLPAIIGSRDRKKAGITAPPHGLYLMEVHYSRASEIPD